MKDFWERDDAPNADGRSISEAGGAGGGEYVETGAGEGSLALEDLKEPIPPLLNPENELGVEPDDFLEPIPPNLGLPSSSASSTALGDGDFEGPPSSESP